VNLLFHVRRVRHRTSLIILHAPPPVSGVGTLVYGGLQPAPRLAAAEQAPSSAGVAPAPAASAPGGSRTPAMLTATDKGPQPADTHQDVTLEPSVLKGLERSICFASESTEIDGGAQGTVREIASILKGHTQITALEVQGHADERGRDDQ